MQIPPMSPPGPAGFGILGGLLLPVSLILAWRKRPPGPVGSLIKAGATEPGVALRPKTAGILRPDDLDRFLRRGLVHRLDDGRVWVDLAALKRHRIRVTAATGAIAGTMIGLAWLLALIVGLA